MGQALSHPSLFTAAWNTEVMTRAQALILDCEEMCWEWQSDRRGNYNSDDPGTATLSLERNPPGFFDMTGKETSIINPYTIGFFFLGGEG